MLRLTLFLFCTFVAVPQAMAAQISSRNNKCLDVKDGRFVNGGQVQLWDCAQGSANQAWALTGGQLKVGNKCLDVVDGRVGNGARLQLWDCFQGSANQAFEWAGSNLRKVGSNFCVDVTDGKYNNGQGLQLYACDFRGVSNQVFAASGSNEPRSGGDGGSTAGGATTFYGYYAISLDDFMAKNPMCRWIKDAVLAASKDQGINATFLATACIVESSCTVPSNGWGPWQFSDEGAWREYGLSKNRQDVWDSAFAAARFFKDLLRQYNNNLDAALRHYNGPIANGGNPRYQDEYRAWMSGKNAWELGI